MLKTFVLVLGVMIAGCGNKAADKKSDDMAKPAGEMKPVDKANEVKPADPAPAAPTPVTNPPPAASPPPAAAATAITSDDDYIARGKAALAKMTDVFKNDGKDCDKIAGDFAKVLDDPDYQGVSAYETAHPDAKKKFTKETKDLNKEFEKQATPALTACSGNKALSDVLAKLK